MPSEQIGEYIIEYAGEELRTGKAFGAYLAIYANSSNPAHRNCVYPRRRVCIDSVYPTREAAEARARELGIEKIGGAHAKTR